jgi:peptidyl-tRNA hydrolase, PTH1 family
VLGDFSKDEVVWLVPFLDAIADAAPLLASGKAPDFMTRVALLTQPPPP